VQAAETTDLGRGLGRVLVVDDDAEIRSALKGALIDEGFEVATASNGRDALDHLRQGSGLPFVILLDLRMPVMDGRAFLAARASDPVLAVIPVIVLTADLASHQVAGASSVLIKPFGLERLLREMSRLLVC
jgi:CheY-like chemotaxis protein